MRTLLKWIRQERYLPYDNRTWTELLGEAKKTHLIKCGCLYFADTSVDEMRIDGKNFDIKRVGKAWYAFYEDEEIELSDKDVLTLKFDKKAFATEISRLLEIRNPLSELSYGADGFYLGNLNLGADYKVFFCYDSYKFTKAMGDLLGDRRPLIILFDTVSAEIQDFTARRGGDCIPFEACITLSPKGFSVFGTLKELLATPRKLKSKLGYYTWTATGHPMPTNPTLQSLKIDLVSPSEISITYGTNSIKIHYSDISIFRNEKTGEFNENWKILLSVALKQPYRNVSGESLKTYVKRLNKDMREFFGFIGTAFSVSESGVISTNFDLYASYTHDKRSRSQVFDGGDSTFGQTDRY